MGVDGPLDVAADQERSKQRPTGSAARIGGAAIGRLKVPISFRRHSTAAHLILFGDPPGPTTSFR